MKFVKLRAGAINILIGFFLLLSALIVMIPLMIALLGSFKNPTEVTAFNLELPEKWLFQNYAVVIEEAGLVRAFLNGFFITAMGTLLTILVSSMASFILARKKAALSRFLYYFFFIGTILPIQFIPTIKLSQWLGFYGGYMNAILLYSAITISFSCFLYTGFIKGIPIDLDEAAFIDGASNTRVFYSVIFPVLKPINMTILILVFMQIWNNIDIPLYFLPDPAKWTMPLSVYQFFGMYSGSNWNLVFAELIMTAIPVIIVFLIAQRHIIDGLAEGAVKS
jgi:raffinose/stachyose/melibiose transport system permease protein